MVSRFNLSLGWSGRQEKERRTRPKCSRLDPRAKDAPDDHLLATMRTAATYQVRPCRPSGHIGMECIQLLWPNALAGTALQMSCMTKAYLTLHSGQP